MAAEQSLQKQVTALAMKDKAFRQELLSYPKAVLERELAITLPRGMTIEVHEDTPSTIHLVLPLQPSVMEIEELSDAELRGPTHRCGGAAHSTDCSISCTCECK